MTKDKDVLNQVQGLAECLSRKERREFNRSKLGLQAWADSKFPNGLKELVERMNARNFISNLSIKMHAEKVKKPEGVDESLILAEKEIIHPSNDLAGKTDQKNQIISSIKEAEKGMEREKHKPKKGRKKISQEKYLQFNPKNYSDVLITITPMSRPLREEEAEKHRNFSCEFITECINYAEDHGVRYFSCSKCSQMKNS